MNSYNFFLYIILTFVWGSTWLAIQYQLGVVYPLWSVVYRFFLAAVLMLIFCFLTRKNMRFTLKQHGSMALQGFLLFALNYALFYLGSQYFISGIVSIIFASIIIMNLLNSRIFLKTSFVSRVVIGCLLGIVGLILVFNSQLTSSFFVHESYKQIFTGLILCLTATLSASFGNVVSVQNQQQKLPILQSSAIGMAYGAIFVAVLAIVMGKYPTFDWSIKYIGSLLYLSLAGTIVGFGAYLYLLSRIGPERVAYIFVLLPVVSLTLSTWLEGFHWTLSTMGGVILILIGNALVLSKIATPQKIELNEKILI